MKAELNRQKTELNRLQSQIDELHITCKNE
jgi:hypothetical protein